MKFDIPIFFENLSRKSQELLKSDKNYAYFLLRQIYIFDHISLSSSQNEKYLRQNL